MSYDEYKVHFAVWAAVKSPLLIGCNVSAMTDETLEILSNAELIAVNQDALGVPADIVYHVGNEAIYAGPLSDGARVVIMVNRHSRDNSQDIYFW
jgi:alpha-galactosidase